MKFQRFVAPGFVLLIGLPLVQSVFASLVPINLDVPKLELKDGTAHTDVTIKTFDPAIGSVMIREGRTFITLSIAVLPDELAAKLRGMAPPAASEPEKPSTVVPAPMPPPSPPPAHQATAEKEPAGSVKPAKAQAAAEKAIKAHAENYFRYKYRFGSNSVTVRSVKFEWQEIEPVQGWAGRYRMAGQAYVDYFDSVGDSFGRLDPAFEVMCDVNAHGGTQIVDVTVK